MDSSLRYYALLFLQLIAYFMASKVIFDKVNNTIPIVIDEYFHIPQGLTYCNGNFSHWDPKITTLPGLYLVSSVIGLYFECNAYNLRFVNLIASCVNLVLFSSILRYVYFGDRNHMKIIIQAVNLTILPPLYFFSHVYYTDVMALTFLLMFTRLCLVNRNFLFILLTGIFSTIMRQTNIVWIAMVAAHKILDIFIRSSRVFGNYFINDIKLSKRSAIARDVDKSKLKRYYGVFDLYCALKYHLSTCLKSFFMFITFHDFTILFTHMFILGGFLGFVYLNGSIVVGDKSAHEATIHTPQLLYFLIFYGVFGLPYVLNKLFSTLKLMFRNKILVILCGIIMSLMVYYNTLVHPYLLADNRHFTFYIWNRWYGKYDHAIFATVPVYIFLLFSIYDNLKDQNCISFLLPYCVSLFLALALQRLIEVRYFLIPYTVLRLRFGRPSYLLVLSEFVWYVLINAASFYIFFNKEVAWQDFDYTQRIIW